MRKKAEIQQKKYFDKKMVQANQALKANPKDRKALVDQAEVKRDTKDFKGAMSDYTKAIALNPKG